MWLSERTCTTYTHMLYTYGWKEGRGVDKRGVVAVGGSIEVEGGILFKLLHSPLLHCLTSHSRPPPLPKMGRHGHAHQHPFSCSYFVNCASATVTIRQFAIGKLEVSFVLSLSPSSIVTKLK